VRGECEEEGERQERQEKENRIVSQTTQVPVKNSRVVTYNRVGGISAFVRLDYEFSVEVVEGRHGSGLSLFGGCITVAAGGWSRLRLVLK
jgi:hypothetical protein